MTSCWRSPASTATRPITWCARARWATTQIPAGVDRQLVVGEHIGAALHRREVRQDDARHLVEAEQMRGEHPAVAGDNAVLFVDQHRVGEAKFADRGGDSRACTISDRRS